MALTRQEARLLVEYAEIFSIPAASYGDQDEEAFCILALFYGLFSVEGDQERRRYRDGILRETANAFGQNSAFFGRISGQIALHIVQPAWFRPRASNADLIKQFKWLLVGATVLQLIGIAPVGGSVRRGVEESIKTGSVRAGIDRARQRLMQGAGSGIVEALVARVGTRFPIGAAAVAIGVIGYLAMERKLNQIREVITERYEADLATEAELRQISNANFVDILQESLGAYWE